MEDCEHKFIHIRTDSFYASMGRYSKKFTLIDYYFCEKCLIEESRKKQVTIGDNEDIPDWAKTITTKVMGIE